MINKKNSIFDFKYNLNKKPKHQINKTNFHSKKELYFKNVKRSFFFRK